MIEYLSRLCERLKYADVAELADALDLGSSEATRECSSHFIRTSGESPQTVRVSHFAEREFLFSRFFH